MPLLILFYIIYHSLRKETLKLKGWGLVLWVEKKRENRYMRIEMGKKEKRERKEREEWMLRNGGLLLEKRISYFDCKYSNPFRGFSAIELQKATDNYSYENRIFEKWADFDWYKGCLEGRVVCLKNYNSGIYHADLEKVSNEIAVAAQVSGHKNALKLLGCCLETQLPTLVFEFPKNGNLDDQLRSSNLTCLPWRIRLKIANEIASVITYLHTAFPRPIIHRDIHSQNIHLDQDFNAKLFDFTLCTTLPEGETQVLESDLIMGTYGYVAPEVLSSGVYSEKSDVFSFGSLLLSLLMGKRYGDIEFFEEYRRSYTKNHAMNEIVQIVDPTILVEAEAVGGEGVHHHHHHHQFQAVFELILRCLRDNVEERPIMLDVARQLKRIQRCYRP